jgi:hypothetical protein
VLWLLREVRREREKKNKKKEAARDIKVSILALASVVVY